MTASGSAPAMTAPTRVVGPGYPQSDHPADRSADPSAARPELRAGHPSDLLRLCALLLVSWAGPIGGLEALNMLAPYARRLGEVPPTFPLLHELEEDGCLAASAGLPRRYRITAAGRREAGRLAAASRARLAERLVPEAWLTTLPAVSH